jgi:phage terminase small subunit
MALTGKKKRFADAVLAGKSNKEAAIAAGYSAATASAAGSRLVKDKEVVAYLAKHRAAAERGDPPPEEPKPTFDLNKAMQHSDPKMFLLAAMNDVELGEKLRIEAAKALMPFMHKKLGEGGKKEQQNDNARKVAGRFAPGAPPRLAASGGKKV